MKLLVLADLHLDAYTDIDATRTLAEAIRETGRQADGLVIAGDLAESASRTWPHALRWLGRLYPPERTVLLPGNHDYHGENVDRLDARLARICAQAGCGFAQGRVLACGDIRLLAATLWTDLRLFQSRGEEAVAESLRQARQGMPDYVPGRIMTGRPERGLRPEGSAAIHRTQRAWLTAELARPWPGRTVVVTHHCPSPELSGPVSPLSPCFTSDLDDLIDRFRPAAWLFGHTHRPAEARTAGGTLLRNVSLGYEHELPGADVIEARVRNGLIDLAGHGDSGGDPPSPCILAHFGLPRLSGPGSLNTLVPEEDFLCVITTPSPRSPLRPLPRTPSAGPAR